MGVSMRDCNIIAAQIGAEFYVKHEAGKSKQYHVVLNGERSDFRVLGDAYKFISDVSLGSMYGDWILATTRGNNDSLTEAEVRTLNEAKSILGKWTERHQDDESVDYTTYAVAVDATSDIYEFLLRYDEMTKEHESTGKRSGTEAMGL